jgi:hypothetical protein
MASLNDARFWDGLMPRKSGSYADHLALADALEKYDRAESVAQLIGDKFTAEIADAWHNELTRLAILCGLPWLRDETIVDWARRRTRSFQSMRRAA